MTFFYVLLFYNLVFFGERFCNYTFRCYDIDNDILDEEWWGETTGDGSEIEMNKHLGFYKTQTYVFFYLFFIQKKINAPKIIQKVFIYNLFSIFLYISLEAWGIFVAAIIGLKPITLVADQVTSPHSTLPHHSKNGFSEGTFLNMGF